MHDEQKLAQIYLNLKKGGVSLGKIIKTLWGIKLVFRLLGIILPYIVYLMTKNILFLIFTCIILGATFEAFLYYFKTLKLWPFTEKIVNWEKVEQIANKIESS